ncbi:MAG: hypothetical protein ACPL25_12275 [Ignavibacteria bacterium]
MKILSLSSITFFLVLTKLSFAQSVSVLYFCERYDSDKGEINVSDRFTKGSITVVVKCDYPLGLENVSIQYDKYNPETNKFEFYKNFSFIIKPEMNYVYFTRNSESDMSFDQPGFYRVFLLDDMGETIASSLIEIIR